MSIGTARAPSRRTGQPPGEATRRFLAAVARRPPITSFANAAKPTGALKRYANTARLALTG